MSKSLKRFAPAIAGGGAVLLVGGTIVYLAIIWPLTLVFGPFDPVNNAADRLSGVMDTSICQNGWQNGQHIYDCSANMPAAVDAAWQHHNAVVALASLWLIALLIIVVVVITRMTTRHSRP